jgi:soluble lytic murein transglycosylase-like protein
MRIARRLPAVFLILALALPVKGCLPLPPRPAGDFTREEKVRFCQAVAPYIREMAAAGERFDVPENVLAGLVYAASEGNPCAARHGFRGLALLGDEEFARAREALAKAGTVLAESPCDPKSSITIGAWYLSMEFKAVEKKGRGVLWRSHLDDWRTPLEYYALRRFAGIRVVKENIDIARRQEAEWADRVLSYAEVYMACE